MAYQFTFEKEKNGWIQQQGVECTETGAGIKLNEYMKILRYKMRLFKSYSISNMTVTLKETTIEGVTYEEREVDLRDFISDMDIAQHAEAFELYRNRKIWTKVDYKNYKRA